MKKFVIVDLEATCYEKRPIGFENEIIEIGAVKLDHTGKEIGRFSKFCKPKVHPIVSAFCEKLTTITQADVDGAEPAEKVIREFLDWCVDCELISWGHYDKNQFIHDMNVNGITGYNEVLRGHKSLKHLHGTWNGLGMGRRGIGMNAALRFERLELDGTHHRGIDDAINIAKIFRKYVNRF